MTECEALRENYVRLHAAARAVVDGARAADGTDRPLCAVEPYLIRDLRRELRGQPAPSGLKFMSVS